MFGINSVILVRIGAPVADIEFHNDGRFQVGFAVPRSTSELPSGGFQLQWPIGIVSVCRVLAVVVRSMVTVSPLLLGAWPAQA